MHCDSSDLFYLVVPRTCRVNLNNILKCHKESRRKVVLEWCRDKTLIFNILFFFFRISWRFDLNFPAFVIAVLFLLFYYHEQFSHWSTSSSTITFPVSLMIAFLKVSPLIALLVVTPTIALFVVTPTIALLMVSAMITLLLVSAMIVLRFRQWSPSLRFSRWLLT